MSKLRLALSIATCAITDDMWDPKTDEENIENMLDVDENNNPIYGYDDKYKDENGNDIFFDGGIFELNV